MLMLSTYSNIIELDRMHVFLYLAHWKDSFDMQHNFGANRGLMVESQTHNGKVASSNLGPAGIVGGGSECTALSPSSIPQRGALEQGTEPPTAPRAPQHKWLPTAPGVCSQCVCVFTAVCVHFGWVNAEHEFRVWVTTLGRLSRHFHFHLDLW